MIMCMYAFVPSSSECKTSGLAEVNLPQPTQVYYAPSSRQVLSDTCRLPVQSVVPRPLTKDSERFHSGTIVKSVSDVSSAIIIARWHLICLFSQTSVVNDVPQHCSRATTPPLSSVCYAGRREKAPCASKIEEKWVKYHDIRANSIIGVTWVQYVSSVLE